MDLKKSDKIKNIASKVANLPTLPTVVAKLLDLVDNPATRTETLAKLISSDPSLTAKILKTANSEYYGLSGEISTVDTAIVVMGYAAVKEMGLSLTVFDNFKNIGALNRFDMQKHWEHSVGVGITARAIARTYLPEDGAELFVAGLLHDIGKMILAQYMPQDFCDVLDFAEKNGVSFFEAEQKILGVMHAEIGYMIAQRWNLPEKIGKIIRYHHNPTEAPLNFRAQAAVINVADAICHLSKIGSQNHLITPVPSSEAIAVFDKNSTFDEEKIADLQKTLFAEIALNEVLHSLF
ncbi:MAG: HDOD domain-containing protein [Chitinivibrionia bacterium]|nr:HDOD domain-containing protein [Chitinivibrionia bacterium]